MFLLNIISQKLKNSGDIVQQKAAAIFKKTRMIQVHKNQVNSSQSLSSILCGYDKKN